MSHGSYNSDDPGRARWNFETKRESRSEYLNADGSHAYFSDKGRNPDGEKVFRIRRRNTIPFSDRIEPEDKVEEFVGKAEHQPWVLYRLPELLAAPPDETVFVCEGEKDVETVRALGLVATTNPNGAGKWLSEFSEHLAGRDVVLLPDNDQRGHSHGRKVLNSIHGVAAHVRIVSVPVGKDITEWVESGATRADLEALVNKAEPVTPDSWLGRDTIVLSVGKSPEITDKISAQLRAAGVAIYQRGGELVRHVRIATPRDNATIRRSAGALILKPANARWLTEQSERHIAFKRAKVLTQTDRDGNVKKAIGYAAVDLPLRYAETYLARGEWQEPALSGLLNAPTLRADGSVLQRPGYDAQSGLLLDFEPDDFAPIPEAPTKEDAIAALEKLGALIDGFPFVDEDARAVAMSGMLTAVIRASIATAPLHAFDAPVAGTGKSKLAAMAGALATGHVPAMMSQGKSEEEDEKRLSTVMMEGDPVIVLDNCERPVGGDFLCSLLTETTVQVRVLGKSERRLLQTTVMVAATGNNLVISGDMVRRTVVCRLDAKDERPELREFDFDPVQEVLARRGELVVAALTALRAYKFAIDRPELSAMGSFEEWSWVRGTLVWCGYRDPALTREVLFKAEPHRAELADVIDVWATIVGGRRITVAEIGAAEFGSPLRKLHDALVSVTGGRAWNAKSVGWWLRRNKDRLQGGRAIRAHETGGSRSAEYHLEGVSDAM